MQIASSDTSIDAVLNTACRKHYFLSKTNNFKTPWYTISLWKQNICPSVVDFCIYLITFPLETLKVTRVLEEMKKKRSSRNWDISEEIFLKGIWVLFGVTFFFFFYFMHINLHDTNQQKLYLCIFNSGFSQLRNSAFVLQQRGKRFPLSASAEMCKNISSWWMYQQHRETTHPNQNLLKSREVSP